MISNLGKQVEGMSPPSIKLKALEVMLSLCAEKRNVFADIGSGFGDFTKMLMPYAEKVFMVDSYKPTWTHSKISFFQTDLNFTWPLESDSVDFAFSLEVIEHIENPRHFFREISRIIKPGGYGYVSTPNNHNIFSKINFVFNDEHRFFQDSCYPAHITAIFKKDIIRLISENGLIFKSFFYNFHDTIPILGISISMPVSFLSSSVGFLFYKPHA